MGDKGGVRGTGGVSGGIQGCERVCVCVSARACVLCRYVRVCVCVVEGISEGEGSNLQSNRQPSIHAFHGIIGRDIVIKFQLILPSIHALPLKRSNHRQPA